MKNLLWFWWSWWVWWERWWELARVPAAFVIVPFLLWAIGYSIWTRTLGDFIRYSVPIAALIAALFMFITLPVLLGRRKQEGLRLLSIETVQFIQSLLLSSAILGVGYYAMGAALKDAYFWLQAHGSSTTFWTVLGTLLGGLILFCFRLFFRSFYGLTEVLVGLTVAAQRAGEGGKEFGGIDNTAFYIAVLTAGVYLVVRGLDNIHQGITKEPLDPAAKLFLNFVYSFVPDSIAAQEEQKKATR